METPNTMAGQITEEIMCLVKQKLPDIKTHEYNRTYEAVLEVLSRKDAVIHKKYINKTLESKGIDPWNCFQ